MKLTSAITFSILLLSFGVSAVKAITDPPIFSCTQPIGTTVAAYSTGTHGIPGDTQTYTGSDLVYHIDDNHVLQCFCPDQGSSGIQSNWWKVSQLSEEEIDFFVRRGWVLIPNGSAWGLDPEAYLVKNDTYSCNGTGGGGSSNGNGGSSSSSSSSNSNSGTGGSVQGTSDSHGGRILGARTLAATGSSQKIILALTLGLTSAFLAYRVSRVD